MVEKKETQPILTTSEKHYPDLGVKGEIPRPHFNERAVETRLPRQICVACEKHHGSVMAEIRCNRIEILRLREVISRFQPAPVEKEKS